VPDLLQSRLKIAPDALSQGVDGEMVILHRERYFSLVDVGARVWTWIVEHGELEGLPAALLEEYDTDEATLRRDVAKLVEQMIAEGLVIKEN
jgi:hypothetical protein